MADQYNVYDTPSASLEQRSRPGEISAGIIEQLRGTGGWVRFISILLFILTGLTIISGLIFGTAGMLGGMEEFGPMDGKVAGVAMAVTYLVLAIIYFFFGLTLFNYASAINRSVVSNHSDDVELAITHQRRFWRLLGVVVLIALILTVVIIVVAMGLGLAAAL